MYRNLKSFLMKSGGQEHASVEEIVQETWIKVWRKAPAFSSKQGSASTWIYTIARNTRIDAIRTQVRRSDKMLNAEVISPRKTAALSGAIEKFKNIFSHSDTSFLAV